MPKKADPQTELTNKLVELMGDPSRFDEFDKLLTEYSHPLCEARDAIQSSINFIAALRSAGRERRMQQLEEGNKQ